MHFTLNPKATEPDDLLVARADERLAHAYEKIALADEQLARVTEQLSKLEREAAGYPSAVAGRRPSRGGPALRGLIGLLLAACIFAAALVSSSSYGDAAKLIIARWAPQLILTSSRPMEEPGPAAVQPSSSAVQVAAAEPMAPQPTLSAQTAPQDVVPAPAPVPPELAQLLQAMAQQLANVEQEIGQLKTSQEQMASDNAKAAEQFKASQEQMTRLIAKASEQTKASEQNLRPQSSAPPPRPIAAPTRKPVRRLPSRQMQWEPDEW